MTPKQLKLEFRSAFRLLDGANCSYKTVHASWISFYRIRKLLTPQSLFDIVEAVKVPKGTYDPLSWAHPWYGDGIKTSVFGSTGRWKKNPSDLFQWAAVENLFPVFSEPSWRYMRKILQGFKCEVD